MLVDQLDQRFRAFVDAGLRIVRSGRREKRLPIKCPSLRINSLSDAVQLKSIRIPQAFSDKVPAGQSVYGKQRLRCFRVQLFRVSFVHTVLDERPAVSSRELLPVSEVVADIHLVLLTHFCNLIGLNSLWCPPNRTLLRRRALEPADGRREDGKVPRSILVCVMATPTDDGQGSNLLNAM
jgi:hypothetical protein